MKKQKITIVVGPTATGKSKIAMKLALEQSGQIINADAFQVYQDLRILTARPSLEDEQTIPHFLYGYADCQTQENVQSWLEKVAQILPQCSHPIVVGGTGLYIHALMNGLNEIPDIPDEIRQKVRNMPEDEIKSLLKGQNILPDPQRQKRALEVYLTTGKSLAYFQKQPPQKMVDADYDVILIQPDRKIIYDRIEQRMDRMFEMGCIQEVQNLIQLKAQGGVIKAIGVKEICLYLNKKCSLNEAKNQTLLSTRHYAKRQMTWFRHQIKPNVIIK